MSKYISRHKCDQPALRLLGFLLKPGPQAAHLLWGQVWLLELRPDDKVHLTQAHAPGSICMSNLQPEEECEALHAGVQLYKQGTDCWKSVKEECQKLHAGVQLYKQGTDCW